MYWLKIRLATLEKRIINELYRIIYLFERFERLCLCRCGGCLLRLLFLLLLLLLGLAGLRRRNRESLGLQPCVVLRCNSAVCLGSTECDGSPEILLERLRAHLAIFQKCLGFAIFGHTNLMALHKFRITGTLRHFESKSKQRGKKGFVCLEMHKVSVSFLFDRAICITVYKLVYLMDIHLNACMYRLHDTN